MGVTSLGFLSCIGSDKEVDLYDEAQQRQHYGDEQAGAYPR